MTAIASQQRDSRYKRDAFETMVRRWENRLRWWRMLLWLPRILAGALLAGIGVLLLTGLSGLFTATQVGIATGAIIVFVVMTGLSVVRLLPRPAIESAQDFDVRFGLQERVSTAFELMEGRANTVDELAYFQIEDAYNQAKAIDPKARIPLEFRPLEWLPVPVLVIVLAILLFVVGSSTATGSQVTPAASTGAVVAAADELRDISDTIATDTSLTDEEREDLLESLETRLDDLEERPITSDEAFAAMNQVEEDLSQRADDLRSDVEAMQDSLSEANAALNNAQNNGAGDESQDSGAAGDESGGENPGEELAETLEEMLNNMSAEDIAALQEAVEAFAETNPELSEALADAAQALEQQELTAAQQAMQEAMQELAQGMQQQQQQQNAAETLEQAAQQAQQAASEIAQSENQGENPTENNQQPASQSQSNRSMEDDEFSGNSPQSSEDGQSGEGQPSDDSQSDSAQTGNEAQTEGDGDMQGQGENPVQGESPSQSTGGQSSSSAGDDAQNGVSEGGSADESSEFNENNPDGLNDGRGYQPIYAPQLLNVDGADDIVLEPDASDMPVVEGDFQENPTGESRVPYNQVFDAYSQAAAQSLETDYIPAGMRDVIQDYFTSLAPDGGE